MDGILGRGQEEQLIADGRWQTAICNLQSHPGTNESRTVLRGLSPLGSTSTIDCQVPSCRAPSITGTDIDGAMIAGITWSAPWTGEP